jgi:hypothetical protein
MRKYAGELIRFISVRGPIRLAFTSALLIIRSDLHLSSAHSHGD